MEGGIWRRKRRVSRHTYCVLNTLTSICIRLCKHICIAAAMVTMRFDLLPFYVDVPGNELT